MIIFTNYSLSICYCTSLYSRSAVGISLAGCKVQLYKYSSEGEASSSLSPVVFVVQETEASLLNSGEGRWEVLGSYAEAKVSGLIGKIIFSLFRS